MSLLVTTFLLLIALGLFLRWHVIDRYLYFHRRRIPHLPPKFPAGNFQGVSLRTHIVTWVKDHYLLFRGRDKLFGYYFGTAPNILITDLDTAREILVTDATKFPAAHSKWNDPLGANLFTMDGEQWRTIRTKLSPVFSAMSARTVLSSLREVGDDLVAYVDQFADKGEPLEARDFFMRYISDAISSSILGVDTAALREEHHPLLNIGARMFKSSSPRDIYFMFFLVSYSNILRLLRMRLLPADITDHFIKTMDEAMRVRMANNHDAAAPRSDLLDLLVRIEQAGCLTDDETGEVRDKITHNQLLGHAFMVFVFGFIITRTALNFALMELAQNDQIQTRLRQEIQDTVPEDGQISYDALESMTYLQQVVDETLRKYAPAAWIERKSSSDYKVRKSNHVIDKGLKVVVPVVGFHNDPNVYKNPEEFNPDRMTKEKMRRRHPCSFMPFGIGNRTCMAQRVGYLYVKLGLVLLLRRFQFSINAKTEVPIKLSPLSADRIPSEGLWLDVQRIVRHPEEQEVFDGML